MEAFSFSNIQEAKKYLGMKKDKASMVYEELMYLYNDQIDEIRKVEKNIKYKEKHVYIYTIHGESRAQYQVKNVTKMSNPMPITMTFQSKTKYDIKKMNVSAISDFEIKSNIVNNKFPIVWWEDAEALMGTLDIVIEWMNKGDTPRQYKVNTILNVKRKKILKKHLELKDMPMFHAVIDLPYKQFRGFRDSGKYMCVPETILHHLQKDGRHKKTTLQDLENDLKLVQEHDEDHNRGFTAKDVVKVLNEYGCRSRLLDINQRQFITGDFSKKQDRHLKLFVGIVYNNHLYYCSDEKHVKSIAEKEKARELKTGFVPQQVYEKSHYTDDTRAFEVKETHDLTSYYIHQFKQDNTIRLVKTENGRITRIEYDDKLVCANSEKSIMTEILGDNFKNQNTTVLGNLEFQEYFPNHTQSKFTKSVFDKLTKHGNIVKSLNEPTLDEQHEYDINKCRTDCWLNNRLGDYEVFNYDSQIEDYDGKLAKGWYYVIPTTESDLDFFMRGSSWYSAEFIKAGQQRGYSYTIKYQLVAQSTIPADKFKPFVKHLVAKYPKHYKKIVCSCVGYRGRTQSKEKKGYVETNFDMAVSAFWDNNDDKIGFTYDENIDKKLWKTMKGKLCNIETLSIDDNTEHYIVEYCDYKTLYENDLPIYNKILENEYLRLHELMKAVGGKIIKLKTDAVIVEGKHNKIKLDNEIGGYKHRIVKCDVKGLSDRAIDQSYQVETSLNWNIIEEQKDFTVQMPVGSCVVTSLAGYGKSHLIKQQPEFLREDTISLGFTNVSCDNLADENVNVQTLNSYFGIDFTTGKGSEKKLKNLKNIKCIIITEAFMTPSYLMGYLAMIKETFPHIKFICEGDPEQIRPVKEEHINWLEKQLFHKLCDGNMVKLLYNKRNNETKNYYKILAGKPLDESKFCDRPPQRLNICKTNKMRVTINNKMMDKSGYYIAKNKKNNKSQDMWLSVDTPIMCVKHNKDLNLKNGKMYNLSSIQKDTIKVDVNTFTDDGFAEHFVVAFAVTNHKVQGITIRESYNIYEWDKMTKRERYTAYSRTADAEFVQIVRSYKANEILWESLCSFFRLNYCIYKWWSKDCHHFYIGHTSDYDKRKREHLKTCSDVKHKNHHNKLYKYMREYGNWKMEILEHFYAPDKRAAEIKEQYYIDELVPSLNMVAAISY